MVTLTVNPETSRVRYFEAARAAGLSAEQAALFASAGYVPLVPMLPYHAAARQCSQRGSGIREIMLDGTRGSAKSHAVIAQVGLDDCQTHPGLKWLFLRKTERAASESFADLIGRVLRGVAHKQNSEKITFPNGSRVLIGGYNDEGDISKYIGIEYDGIVVEEATQLTGDKLEMLMGSVRTSRDDWVPRVYLTTNPGDIGHAYIKARYIDPARQNKQTFTRRFFSSYKDNPFINPEYKAYLDSLKGDLKKRWADGDWDVFAGQAIAFKPEMEGKPWHVIKPCEIPPYWVRKTGFDWGFANPMCNLWGARNPDNGRWIVYREVYGEGLTDPRQVETIRQYEDPEERIAMRYADPSIWAKKTQDINPTSTADVFMAHGLYMTKAVNDRIPGKRKVDALLEPLPDGLPGLMVFETCTNLIRTLPSLVYSKTQPEDIDTTGEDHAYDALRYLLTDDIAQKPRQQRTPQPPPITRFGGL
jgi:phage terminase large subunit